MNTKPETIKPGIIFTSNVKVFAAEEKWLTSESFIKFKYSIWFIIPHGSIKDCWALRFFVFVFEAVLSLFSSSFPAFSSESGLISSLISFILLRERVTFAGLTNKE